MRIIRISFVACTVLAVACAFARAQGVQPFSADMTSTLSHTGVKSTGKIYSSPPKLRIDTSAGGRESVMIIDASTKTSYMLMPQQHAYMELHADQSGAEKERPLNSPPSYDPKHPCPADATCKKTGTDTVAGRACDSWEMTSSRGTTKTCIDQKLFYSLRTVFSSGGVVELSNVKEGKPDASLFVIPAGYRKIDMGSMKGGRPPQ
jgi:hypothetical protein